MIPQSSGPPAFLAGSAATRPLFPHNFRRRSSFSSVSHAPRNFSVVPVLPPPSPPVANGAEGKQENTQETQQYEDDHSIGDSTAFLSSLPPTAPHTAFSRLSAGPPFSPAFPDFSAALDCGPNYKTELCDLWHSIGGRCLYGSSCYFAHGPGELRPRHYGARYKLQPCKNFHEARHCRFEGRCKFLHDEIRFPLPSGNEFALFSPSSGILRVETVQNQARMNELINACASQANQEKFQQMAEEEKKNVLEWIENLRQQEASGYGGHLQTLLQINRAGQEIQSSLNNPQDSGQFPFGHFGPPMSFESAAFQMNPAGLALLATPGSAPFFNPVMASGGSSVLTMPSELMGMKKNRNLDNHHTIG